MESESDGDPFAMEQFLSLIEAGGAEALRFITEHGEMPKGPLRQQLIAFMAVMISRGPGAIGPLLIPA